MVYIGTFISHLDFLSVFQWLSGAFIRLSLFIFLLLDLWSVKKTKQKIWLLSGIFLIMLIGIVLPFSENQVLTYTRLYLLPAVFIWFLFLLISLSTLEIFSKSAKEEKNNMGH
ncbi:hypothetical protein [Heyndrickxia acidicola]|uniref:hypothetical protein n=1 Tax=Heyndrickxia acidicola TaxID=209389 RepID=UPI0009FC4D8B|nr:hypothetical protein [Heyndrickxia acidicola]